MQRVRQTELGRQRFGQTGSLAEIDKAKQAEQSSSWSDNSLCIGVFVFPPVMVSGLLVQLVSVRSDLRDVLYSSKWTPDAFLLAKKYVKDDSLINHAQ